MSNIRTNTPRETNETALLSDPGEVFKNPQQLQFIRQLVETLRRVTGNVVRRDVGTPQIILAAPDGGNWKVTVDNTGALKTERVVRGTT